jgi:hypothetical protein
VPEERQAAFMAIKMVDSQDGVIGMVKFSRSENIHPGSKKLVSR